MSDYDSSYSDDSDSDQKDRKDQKELPWHSSSTDLQVTSATPEATPNSEDKQICSNDSSVPSLDLANKLNITPEIPKTSQLELEDGNTVPDKALSWKNKTEVMQSQDPPKEINILLLGESGVGKSTFINSFANYMKHEHFEAVEQSNLSVLIPAKFTIFDKEYQQHEIEIGVNDDNECLDAGAAATQDVKTYVFNITLENKPYLIRLVDTPGMGDPRGIAQDNKNCDYLLNHLARLEKVHAICLLLKPTNTRLDVFLNYCVTQILSRLEKSATQNICFLFTNTRGQNYTPGDTYTQLQLLVKKIKDTNNVTIRLSHANVFCFDNEAFRFLASIKQNVQFKEGILEANIQSWKYSYKEIHRLLSYIVQLNPHDAQKTVSINHARKMVLQLSQPLAEIVQLIGDNIYNLDQHTHQLCMENQTLDELKQKLYMPVIDIRAKELPQPVTVCTSAQCSTVYKVGDKNKYHYKQRCHNPCYLNNVPAEIVGDPKLLHCEAMAGQVTCQQCGCRFNTHMHIYYETETFESKVVDENIQENITNKEDATREKQDLINKILNHKEELEKEHKHIIKCSAAFAHFLQKNAITPMNDSLKEYVKYLITREENLGAEANTVTLDYLKKLLNEYEQERNVLTEALKHDTVSSIAYNSPNMIEQKIKELFTLEHFGKKIKTLYDMHQSGGLREHKQSELVVKEKYNLSIFTKFTNTVRNTLGLGKSKTQQIAESHQQKALEDDEKNRLQQRIRELEYFHSQSYNFPYNTLRDGHEGQFYFGSNSREFFGGTDGGYRGWDGNSRYTIPSGNPQSHQHALAYEPEKMDAQSFEQHQRSTYSSRGDYRNGPNYGRQEIQYISGRNQNGYRGWEENMGYSSSSRRPRDYPPALEHGSAMDTQRIERPLPPAHSSKQEPAQNSKNHGNCSTVENQVARSNSKKGKKGNKNGGNNCNEEETDWQNVGKGKGNKKSKNKKK